jgi:SnoaL-like polyketide cyclase
VGGCFTDDGTFNDVSAGVVYRGPKELGITVEIYAKAFPDMHRELYEIYVSGDVVVVELSLNGTHTGDRCNYLEELFPLQAR